MSSLEEIRALRREGEALYAKNNRRATVAIEDSEGRLELGPKGSDNYILPISSSKLDLAGVQKMITKGVINVGPFSEFQKEWDEGSEKSSDETKVPLADFQVTVEADKGRKDLIEKECLVTGKKVFQSLEDVNNDKPPLHESVADMEREFVVQHIPKADGGHETTWTRVKIG